MLSQSFSPFRQRRPNRKASTPFLPGAWPSSSGSEEPPKDDISSSVNEPHDANGHFPALNKSPPVRISPALPNIDHVMKFHRQISDTLSPTTQRQAAVSREGLSIVGGIQTTSESDTSHQLGSNAAAMRDDPHRRMAQLPFPRSKILSKRTRTASGMINPAEHQGGSARYPPSDMHTSVEATTIASDPRRFTTVVPLHNFTRDLPPLDITCSSLFLPQSDLSNFSSPIYPSSPDADSPPAPPSVSSTSRSLAESITSQHCLLQSPSGIASSFYPVPEHPPTKRFGLPTPSTSASSYGFNTDSPILPSDDQRNSSRNTPYSGGRQTVHQLLTPSSADMDVFGRAASRVMDSASESIVSLPTSFQSASSEGSVSTSRSMSINETARGRLLDGPPLFHQSVASISSSMGSALGDFPTPAQYGDEDGIFRVQRSGAPSPSSLGDPTSQPPPDPRTINSPNQVHHMDGPTLKVGAFAPLIKVKKFGGRIKRFLKGKFITNEGKNKAVVAVPFARDFTSEHPIPRPSSHMMVPVFPSDNPKPNFQAPSGFPPVNRAKRRQSMPITSGSMSNVSRPRPLRPASFLPLDTTMKRSIYPVSVPNLVALTPPRPRRSSQGSPCPQVDERPPRDLVMNNEIIDETRRRKRARTQTAPPIHQETQSTKVSRRFSLTAALSKSALDTLRTTVVPHPALPKVPPRRSNFRDDFVHRRSASTSANDAWNAAKCGDSPKAGSFHKDRKSRPLSTVHGAEEGYEQTSPNNEAVFGAKDIVSKGKTSPQQPIAYSSRRLSITSPQPQRVTRPRSHTHSSVLTRLPPHLVQLAPGGTANTGQQEKRRSRGFSIPSVISKRALRARSMIIGRSPDLSTPPPSSPDNVREGALVTSVSGVSFSMVTPPTPQHQAVREGSTELEDCTTSGCADYDPDIVLDKMSFAETPDVRSMLGSHTDLSMSARSSSDAAVHSVVLPRSPQLSVSTSQSPSREDPRYDNVGGVPGDNREEEREFMRALGLQFDEIVRRARSEQTEGEHV